MSEVFISHSTKNADTAKEFQDHLQSKGTSVFLASTSIAPGAKWSTEILARLRESKVVLFLASKEACDSKYANQEIGGAVVMEKTLIPILCGVSPDDLPGWSKEFQAIDLTEDRGAVRTKLDSIAEAFRIGRFWKTVFIFIGLIWLVWLLTKKD